METVCFAQLDSWCLITLSDNHVDCCQVNGDGSRAMVDLFCSGHFSPCRSEAIRLRGLFLGLLSQICAELLQSNCGLEEHNPNGEGGKSAKTHQAMEAWGQG